MIQTPYYYSIHIDVLRVQGNGQVTRFGRLFAYVHTHILKRKEALTGGTGNGVSDQITDPQIHI